MKTERVKDWISSSVITVRQDTNLPEAHQIMVSKNIRRLPVVDKNGRLAGIITLGDVRSAQPSPASSLNIWEMNHLLSSLAVERVMSADPVTIHPEQTIGEAARTMLEKRVSGLPVVDQDNAICGIITESDIFSMVVLHEWNEQVND